MRIKRPAAGRRKRLQRIEAREHKLAQSIVSASEDPLCPARSQQLPGMTDCVGSRGTSISDNSEVDTLLKRLDLGLPPDVFELTTISVNLTRGECLALRNANIKTIEQVKALNVDQLRVVVGERRAQQILSTLGVEQGA